MARFASQAEYYRHHRRCMTLALELRCTPAEAELELEKRAVAERFRETHERWLAAQWRPRRTAPGTVAPDAGAEPRNEPWMMRD